MDDFKLHLRYVLARYVYVHMSYLLSFIHSSSHRRFARIGLLLEVVRESLLMCFCFSLLFFAWGRLLLKGFHILGFSRVFIMREIIFFGARGRCENG